MFKIALNELVDEENENEKEQEIDCKMKKHYSEDGEEKYVVHSIECEKIEETDVKLLDNIVEKKFYNDDVFNHAEFKIEIFISQIDDNHRKISVKVTDDYDIEEFEEYEYENDLIENLKESGHYY